MKTEDITFLNDRGVRLDGRLHHPEGPSRGGVVFCHGLFSSKDAYKIVNLTGDIAAAGFTLLTFDFSFVSGMPDSFLNFSIYQEVRDLESAASFLLGSGVSSLHLIGSSMGGLIALLFAASRQKFLRSLTLIATPVDLSRLLGTLSGKIDFEDLPKAGTTTIDGIPIHNEFFHEALSLDMQSAMRSVAVPALIIHGARDAVVDVENAHRLRDSLISENKVIIVPDGDHNLTREEDIRMLKSVIIPWISTHENNGVLGR